MKAAERDSAFMRGQLAAVGIFLDERKPMLAARGAASTPTVDRDQIRAVLVTLGAPTRHLEWLTASCPSLDHALTYTPMETP